MRVWLWVVYVVVGTSILGGTKTVSAGVFVVIGVVNVLEELDVLYGVIVVYAFEGLELVNLTGKVVVWV